MKERPIIFNDEMVRAILAGRKTQTRRIVKPQPEFRDVGGVFHSWAFKKRHAAGFWLYPNAKEHILPECQFGQPDDRLLVRESIRYSKEHGNHYYFADSAGVGNLVHARLPKKSVPSIHMPRWASRITLEITGVRVERLQDIGEEDAIAEGVETHIDDGVTYYGGYGCGDVRPDRAFQVLWQSIYGVDSWGANPWVWVIEFKRLGAA